MQRLLDFYVAEEYKKRMLHEILMPLPQNCIEGRFIQRVKRFSVEFEHNGKRLWAHTNNSGSMLGLLRPGEPVLVSDSCNPARKLRYTLELVKPSGSWVGVNTLTPNRLLKVAFERGLLPWASGYTSFKAEAPCGNSRLDALLTGPGLPNLWVECKNVTMVEDDVAAFPDAVSTRAHKHVREMMDMVAGGERAAFFFCVQRNDGKCFAPADYIDPEYARLFYEGLDANVEAYPHVVHAGSAGYRLADILPIAGRARF